MGTEGGKAARGDLWSDKLVKTVHVLSLLLLEGSADRICPRRSPRKVTMAMAGPSGRGAASEGM